MDDFISRKEVKEAAWEGFINRLVEDQGMYGYLVHLVDEVFDAIPAADVRPVVRGKWERNERGNYICSNCKSEHNAVFGFIFCPNCGADMREEN